jgi:hypothetical protein
MEEILRAADDRRHGIVIDKILNLTLNIEE